MKVILLVNDKKLGRENDIVEVADAYARNVLIPKKVAVAATKEALAQRESRVSHIAYLHKIHVEGAQKQKQEIKDLGGLTLKVSCAADGKMFGSITSKDISLALAEKGLQVDKHNIILPGKIIKSPGRYNIDIKLFEDITASLMVDIAAE